MTATAQVFLSASSTLGDGRAGEYPRWRRDLRRGGCLRRGRCFVYVTPETVDALEPVREALLGAYEDLEVVGGGTLRWAEAAWDTFHRRHDASQMIAQLPEEPGCGVSLWVVPVDIFAVGRPRIFGVCAGRKAVVSAYYLGLSSALASVVIHEVGHALGLPHCGNACAMRASRDVCGVRARPDRLCAACARMLIHQT